jgi:hypothetical protein
MWDERTNAGGGTWRESCGCMLYLLKGLLVPMIPNIGAALVLRVYGGSLLVWLVLLHRPQVISGELPVFLRSLSGGKLYSGPSDWDVHAMELQAVPQTVSTDSSQHT